MAFSRRETPFSALSIYKAKLDGSGITQFTKPREKLNNHRYPVFSNSGRQIVFSSDNGEIIVLAAGGGDERVLIRGGAYPSWSPDDQYLVFHRAAEKSGRARLFIIKADGSSLRQLTF
ncbi:MAG: TolB family protein [bacterium]